MKTLHNYLILYDAECPMCTLYTRAFTTTGMLDPTGRAPYQNVLNNPPTQTPPNNPLAQAQPANPLAETPPAYPPTQTPPTYHALTSAHPSACPLIDRQRAVNEIALINIQTGEVNYGIDSLFKVIGHSFPIFHRLFSFQPFIWLMRKLYSFISYNRKVIIPAKSTSSLQPTFNLKHRLAYLIFTILIAAAILTRYAHLLTGILPIGTPWREYLICSGQVLYQGIVVSVIAPTKRWEYLGNMMTISLAGSLALLPAITISILTHLPNLAATAWFILVAGLMLLEHIRRTKLLGLDWTLTISWILYRLVVLLLILL